MASLTHATELAGRLDRLRLSPFHWRLLILSGLGWMFDAMDVTLIAFIVAALAPAWNLGLDQSRWVVVMGFVGMFVGAGVSGVLADRYGRKPLLIELRLDAHRALLAPTATLIT